MIIFVPFEPRLDRSAFSCGKPDLDQWLQRHASQQERSNSARATFAVDERDARIAAFFTLVTYRLEVEDLTRALPTLARRYPMTAMLRARLAVDTRYQGSGLGKVVLFEALERLLRSSMDIGFEVIVVDALDDDAARFYLKYGFRRFADHSRRLFMTAKDLRTTFAQARGGDPVS